MGVDTDLFLGARPGRKLDAVGFRALVVDLIAKRVVTRPCALFTGSFGKTALTVPLSFANMTSNAVGKSEKGARLRYKGGESKKLLAALDEAAYGKTDVAIHFDCFDLDEPKQKKLFEREGWYGAYVVVYALKSPRPIEIQDFYSDTGGSDWLTLQFYATVTGRRTLDDLEEAQDAPLVKVLTEHLGPLVSATACT